MLRPRHRCPTSSRPTSWSTRPPRRAFAPAGGTGPVPTSGPASCETQLQTEYGSNGSFVNGPTSFKSDNIWSYEVGEKLRLFDNRVTVNGSLYFEKWGGVQQANALSKCGYTYSVNAGDAHVRGGELEIQAIVVPELTVSGNVGYTHAALVSSTLIDAGFNRERPSRTCRSGPPPCRRPIDIG